MGLQPLYRTFAILSLPLSILAAVGFRFIGKFLARGIPAFAFGRVVLPVLSGIILLNGALHVRDLLPVRSSYRDATEEWVGYIKKQGGTISFFPGSVWPIWHFYLSAQYDSLPPGVKQQVRFYPEQKDAMPPQGDFDAFDFKRYYRSLNNDQPELLDYFGRMRDMRAPVIRIYNPASDLPLAYSEVGGQKERRIREKLSRMSPSRYIEIYDLRSEKVQQQDTALAQSQTSEFVH